METMVSALTTRHLDCGGVRTHIAFRCNELESWPSSDNCQYSDLPLASTLPQLEQAGREPWRFA